MRSNQLNLFDLREGRRRKKVGKAMATTSRRADLDYARLVAKQIAMSNPSHECHIDLVQQVIMNEGISLGNAAGSLFKREDWLFTGRFVQSSRASNHATLRRVWKLK